MAEFREFREIFSSLSTHDIGMNKVPFVAARLQYVVQIYLPLVIKVWFYQTS